MNDSDTPQLTALQKLYHTHREAALEEFKTFLKFSSISADPAFKDDVKNCSLWLQDYISDMGFKVEIWESEGHHPVIFASSPDALPSAPVLLIYNHYDVQPVDPLDLWITPPFQPTERDGAIYARGAQDNKGQCFYVLQALKILKEQHGSLPINIKLCIEGEEECGSAGLFKLLSQKEPELKADYVAIVDLGIKSATEPSLTLGIRGILTMEVEVSGPKIDLHSGSHGGLCYNPIHALVEILAKTRDDTGKITIPGFYENVENLSQSEKAKLSFAFDEDLYAATFGSPATGGERQLPPLERNWLRPALEINGISGGYTGNGFKTVIPAKASAKLSCRLVPNQVPKQIGTLIATYLKGLAPPGIDVSVTVSPGSGPAVRTPIDSVITNAFAESFREVYQKECVFIYEGASIPIAAALANTSKAEMILLGVGLTDDAIHSPNERFSIDRLEKGCMVIARGIELLAKALGKAPKSQSETEDITLTGWVDDL